MLRAFVQSSTPPYRQLTRDSAAESEGRFSGTLVYEAELDCLYTPPGEPGDQDSGLWQQAPCGTFSQGQATAYIKFIQ
ncbi:voltage-dependent L-type calcium channel subunit alpha-1C-like [Erinaceus europaeus]|uniref:Voltage-dependent L-type calcium channel subunit alpha-1C-like n=1 Tax=Erinaceus europaeus TaxID=9365 RepID=A0ABM3WV69_ERIEU|nr:voltage-dependent L-type calcium channel subunit alpha-1C-like [Erinaceus europaeus]